MVDEPPTSGLEGLASIAQAGHPWYDSVVAGVQFAEQLLAEDAALGVAAVGVRGFASIAEPVRPWINTIRVCAQPDDAVAPEPDVTALLLDAQLERFAEDVARGIVGKPEERHAIILGRKGSRHALLEAIWRHVDRLRNEENG